MPLRNAHSYSEIKTFWGQCKLQHFYRYFMRLRSRRWKDNKFFVIGNLVHNTIERLYHGADPEKAFTEIANKEEERLRGKIQDFPFREFQVKRHIAKNLVSVFSEEVRPEEPYEIIDTEVEFNVELEGIPLRGMADRLYALPVEQIEGPPEWVENRLEEEGREHLRLIGEEKTRSTSTFPGSDYEETVRNDLQTHMYMWAFQQMGRPVEGVVHTSYRKAPKKYRDPSDYDFLGDQLEAIDGYYGRARTPYRRVALHCFRPPVEELKRHVRRVYEEMEAFYENPYKSVDEFTKYDPSGMPCMFCDFRPVCHEGEEIGSDYAYRPDTS